MGFQTGFESRTPSAPEAVGGDQKSATTGEDVVKENKVISAV